MLLKTEGCTVAVLESGFRGKREISWGMRSQGSRRSTRFVIQCATGGDSDGMGGDVRVQKALVEMIQMEVSKVKMSQYVDERSQYMQSVAQDYHRDHARISLQTMKELDAAGSRILRELEASANSIEKELRKARADFEDQTRSIAEYQRWSAHERNKGLFFKTLYSPPERGLQKELVVSSSSGDFTSGYKKFLSGGISLVLASFVYSSGSALLTGSFMRPWKLASYGIILTLLLTQLAYVEVLVGDESDREAKLVSQETDPRSKKDQS